MATFSKYEIAREESGLSNRRPWVLGGIILIWFTTYFVRLAWLNVSASARHTLGSSAAELASFITFFFIGYVIANVIGGYLVDRLGSKRVLVTAILALAVATCSFSLVSTATQGWVVQFTMGLSCGSFYAAAIKLIATWFEPKERGMGSGLMFVAGPAAVIAGNIVYPSLIQEFGWQTLYILLGTYVALVALAASLLIHNNRLSATNELAHSTVVPAVKRTRPIVNSNLLLICCACFGTGWGTWGFTFCSNLLLVRGNIGLNGGAAATVALWFGIGGVVIIPLYGFLSDCLRGGRAQLYIIDLVLMVVALFVFSEQTSLFGFCLSAFFLGMAAYAFLPVLGGLLPDLVPSDTLGATAGISNAAGQLAAAFAPLAVGAILDRSGSVMLSLATLATGPLVGAFSLTALVVVNRRRSIRAEQDTLQSMT